MKISKQNYGRIGLEAYKTLCLFQTGQVYEYDDYSKEILQELKYAGYIKIWSDMFGTHLCLVGYKCAMPLDHF